ncbi:MAG: HAMP domain-containing sensor histidine kinase [Acidimicrobiia bacterium]|nr:HAMP domain-containing sensor histidine kinase [Acidimicrobiia bacterium]
MGNAPSQRRAGVPDPELVAPSLTAQQIKWRWTFGGAVFGLLFPLVGWWVARSQLSGWSIVGAHESQPVLYIVDLAPLVLGFAGLGIGAFHARLAATKRSVERRVRERTAELRVAMEDLERLMAEKDMLLEGKARFIATVSHELRTPLTSVVGLAYSLAEVGEGSVVDGERHQLIEMLVEESEEVAAIVEDLLVAARSETGQLALAVDRVELDAEAVAVAESMHVDLARCLVAPATVAADPVRVRQVIRNLLSNAKRYGGPDICVETNTDGEWGTIVVSDNGDGIPPDLVDAVFAPFNRAHAAPDDVDPVGLGLSVSRHLARLMGGDLSYTRTEGWTSFTLELPVPADASFVARPHLAV